MEILIFWVIGTLVATMIAAQRYVSMTLVLFVSLLLSPLIGILVALFMTPSNKEQIVERTKLNTGDHKKCPFCAEVIKAEAIVCRYCGKEVKPSSTSTSAPRVIKPREDWHMTAEQYAQRIGQAKPQVINRIRRDQLQGYQVNNQWYVSDPELRP